MLFVHSFQPLYSNELTDTHEPTFQGSLEHHFISAWNLFRSKNTICHEILNKPIEEDPAVRLTCVAYDFSSSSCHPWEMVSSISIAFFYEIPGDDR